MCSACGFAPCICSYLQKIAEGGSLAHLRPAALTAYGTPLPHLGVLDGPTGQWSRGACCPCPKCYALRLSTWEAAA